MRSIFLFVALILVASTAFAQSPAPDPLSDPNADWQAWLQGGPSGDRDMPPSLAPFNYVREFDQIVDFLATWQLADPDSSDYGGMIEAEAGYLGDVIQTDNTLEAIWCWSRYREFSGRDTYDENVEAAWVYCTNYPAWAEEGAVGDNYYRAHNCAWGLTAVLKYKAATGDASYDAYAETCAQYIIDNPLNIWTGNLWTQRLNFFVKGWCAGNLYLYGEEIGNAAYMAEAVTQGQDVLDWINVDPVLNLAVEYWAMSSGTAVWGLCNSLFRDDPLLGQTWLGLHAYEVQNWQDWYSVPGYDWDSSWNVAYANAKFAMSDVQGNPNQAFFGALTTNALLSYDTDDDGGIVAESMDPVTEDMSWVTCYLCKFGVDRMMGDPHGDDVGILSFVGYESGDAFGVRGDTIPIIVTPTNWGLSDAPGVTVHFEGGGAGSGSWVRDLSFAEIDTLVVNPAWIPDEAGIYVLTVWTEYPGDEESINDELELEFNISPSTDVPESASGRLRLLSNPFVGGTEFRLSLAAEESVRLEIFDVRGRRVDVIEAGTRGAGEHRLEWDGRGSAAGIYLYRFESTRGVETGRMVKLK